MDTDAILSAIRQAFPERPLPDMTLRQAQLADQSMSREITDAERMAEGDKDHEVVWTRIDDTTLAECDAALSHLSEEGFVYYLPAFLTLATRQLAAGVAANSYFFSGVVFYVTHVRENYALARLKRLTDPQIQVVIEFLRMVRGLGGVDARSANEALKSYWETPEAHRRTLVHVP